MVDTKKVTVYTSLNCAGCVSVKRFLSTQGIVFEEKNIMDNLQEAVSLGIRSVPYTVVGEEYILGSDEEALCKLKEACLD